MQSDQVVRVICIGVLVLIALALVAIAYHLGGQRTRSTLAAELRPLLRAESDHVVGQVVAAVSAMHARAERNRRYEGRGRGERLSG